MKEVLTFSLISSNQLRTVGNIHTLISTTLMLQTSLLLLKNNFIFQEKVLSYSAPGCVEPRREAEERCRPEAATRMIPASPSRPLRSHLPVILQSSLPLHLHQDPLWEAKQRYFSQDLFLKHHRPRNFSLLWNRASMLLVLSHPQTPSPPTLIWLCVDGLSLLRLNRCAGRMRR